LIDGLKRFFCSQVSVDEMERKKEKIMLLSLQRRQQQEEAKARKEIDVMQRREKDQMKDEEKARKKEEQMARRAQILEHHRIKKAVEEAEREGKTLDRHTAELYMRQQQQQQQSTPQPKMRAVKSQRPRPKTIHVETNSSSHDISGSGKKGSISNLTGNFRRTFAAFFVVHLTKFLIFLSLLSLCSHSKLFFKGIGLSSSNSNTMRRDYYRGSQDSLSMKGRKSFEFFKGDILSF
jgi:flagellar biosynthesis GTPase FlhF